MFRLTLSICLLICIVLPITVFYGQSEQAINLQEFGWLLGTWKRETRTGILYERWTQASRKTFEGESFIVSDGDTSYVEFLRLEQYGDEIYYIPKVPENPFPVPFKFVSVNENKFVFENPGHDFPQRIIYQPQTESRLVVRIETIQEGNKSGRDFQFQKVD